MVKKYIIYTDSDDTIDSIIEKIISSPKYKNPIYILLWEESSKIFLNKLNIKIFSENLKKIKSEVILISKNFKLFDLASQYNITVQNVVDENLNFSNVLITKKRIGQWQKKEEELNYSLSNLNEKVEKLKIYSFITDKKAEMWEVYKQKKKTIIPLIVWSFFMLFFILFLIIPKSKVYIKPSSKQIKLISNIIFVDPKTNEEFLVHNRNKNIVKYKIIEKLYEKSMMYQSETKVFEWNSAKWLVLIENTSWETFSIKKGSKMITDDKLIYRTDFFITIPWWKRVKDEKTWKEVFKNWEVLVSLTAEDFDNYNNVIWSRWNLKAWTKFSIIKLSPYLSRFISIKATKDFAWWTIKWKKVVTWSWLLIAGEKIKADMINESEKEMIKMIEKENKEKKENYALFWDKNYLKIETYKIDLPKGLIWKRVDKYLITWAIVIKAMVYNFDEMYTILEENIKTKISPNMALSFIDKKNIEMRAFEVDDKANRIKSTVVIYWREDYDLFWNTDFSKWFRIELKNKLTNLTVETAEKYIKNISEVSDVKIKLWPPFVKTLPKMPWNIDIEEFKN